ncbi:MAG: hypothetical protein R6X16_07070 [Anaerolineae bacterium]
MWNRIVLLTCGMVIGWGLANYWTCPADDIPRHRYRMTLGLVVAVALCLWIAWDDLPSGFTALLIVGLSALVSYAGRARQISSLVDRPIDRPVPEAWPGVVSAVLLVSHALPVAYTGPEHWVSYFRRVSGEPLTVRGWFFWPRIFARIRARYQQLVAPSKAFLTPAVVQERLQALTGSGVLVSQAHPYSTPRLGTRLIALAGQGISMVFVAPIDLDYSSQEALLQQISLSQAAIQSTQVVLLDNTCLGLWTEKRALEQIAALVHGGAWPGPVALPVEQRDALAGAIRERMQAALPAVSVEGSTSLGQECDLEGGREPGIAAESGVAETT